MNLWGCHSGIADEVKINKVRGALGTWRFMRPIERESSVVTEKEPERRQENHGTWVLQKLMEKLRRTQY